MRLHYMLRDQHCNMEELRTLSSELEDCGYHSVLLTFHSQQADYFVKSAAALTPGHKLKYMIALRPYHVSPQYCAMMTIAYNEIDKDRLVFNWVAGDFHNRQDEPHLEFDVFAKSELIDTIEKRTTFLRDFVKMYKLYCPVYARPGMVFSGFSDYTLDTVRMFNGTSLCMLDTYRENIEKFHDIENKLVSVSVSILKSNNYIKEYTELANLNNPRLMSHSIVGDYETVKKQILELENEKITDLLIVTTVAHLDKEWNKENYKIVSKLVKEINSEVR